MRVGRKDDGGLSLNWEDYIDYQLKPFWMDSPQTNNTGNSDGVTLLDLDPGQLGGSFRRLDALLDLDPGQLGGSFRRLVALSPLFFSYPSVQRQFLLAMCSRLDEALPVSAEADPELSIPDVAYERE